MLPPQADSAILIGTVNATHQAVEDQCPRPRPDHGTERPRSKSSIADR
jgi:hypothetical protein